MQRLDKILSDAGVASRKELKSMIRAGRIAVGGTVCRDETQKFDEQTADVTLDGAPVEKLHPVLLMMHKPAGLLTAAEDPRARTVMELVPEKYRRFGVMPVGRLDKETEGLLLLTNDGELAHRIISPKYGIVKKYYAEHEGEAAEADVRAFQEGLTLADGLHCLPARLEPMGAGRSYVYVQEGKYHQVRRMMASRGLTVTYLRRETEAHLSLGDLPKGAVRELDIVAFRDELAKML